MNKQNKLSQQQKQQELHASHQAQAGQEFSSPEELLRFDAGHVEVPASIARNLQKSTAGMQPPTARPWWKRIFGS